MTIHPISRRSLAAAVAVLSAVCAIACSGGGSAPGDSVPLAERMTLEGFSYQPPTSWKAEPPTSSMRLAQYRIEPAPGDTDPGECALFHFPGSGGPVQANIDRWIGQFEQPDGSASADHASVERFTNEGLSISFVDVSGTYTGAMSGVATPSEPKTGYRMVAGVVETAQGPWFMKCTGPSATMAATAPGLKAMLRSARG